MDTSAAVERGRLRRLRLLRMFCRALLVSITGGLLCLLALSSTANAAVIVFTSAPASPDNDATPTWTFTEQASTCELSDESGLLSSTPCDGGTYTATLTKSGTYTLTVSTNGGQNQTASSTYEYDGTPPPAPTVTGPAGPSADRDPSYSISGELGGTWACALEQPDGTSGAITCSEGSLPLSLPGADGTYTLSVTQTDDVGNVSAVTSVSYVLDTTAPAAPTVVAPASPDNDTTPTFGLSGEAGGTWTCTLTAPDTNTTTPGCAASSFTPTLSGDGTWTLAVTQTDAAGNTSSATTVSYLLDTVAPAAPVVAVPPSTDNDSTPTFELSGEAGGSWTCTLTAPDGAKTTPVCGAGSFTPTLSGEGTWTLSVTQTDAAGNTSSATTVSYVLDTVAPAAPGVATPTSPGNDTTPTFELTGEAGGSWTCTLTAPGGGTTMPSCAAGAFTPMLSGDGTWSLAVTQTDAAGNTSSATTVSYVLDTIAPGAPSVAAPASPGKDRTPTFTLGGEPGGTWTCTVQAPDATSTSAPCDAGELTLDLSTRADGTYTLTVVQTDAAGNASDPTSSRYLLDTTAPAAPGVTGPTGPSSDSTPTFTLSGEPGGTWTCTVTAPDAITTAVDCAAGKLTLSLTKGDGIYTLTVTQTDAAGNASAPTSVSYELDSTGPPMPTVTGPSGPSSNRRPTFTLGGEPGGTWACTVTTPDGTTYAVGCAAGDLTLDLLGPDGTYVLTVVQTDDAGTTSPDATASYVLDTTAPGAPGVTGPSGPSNDRTPTFTLTGEDGATWTCTLTTPNGSVTAVPCAAGELRLDLSGPDGTYQLSVVQTDSAGNTSAATTVSYVLDTTAPAAPDVTGPSGPSNDRKPRFTLTGEDGGTWTCTVTAPDGTVSPVPCAAGDLTLDLTASDGTYTLTVTQADAAGNRSGATAVSYLLDTTAPNTPGVTGPSGPSNDRTPAFTLTGEPGGSWTCTLTGPDGATTAVACAAGDLTLDLAGPDGTYTLTVTQTDAAGTTSASTSVSYLLDTTPPTVPAVTGPAGPSSDRGPAFTLTGEVSATWTCTLIAPDGSASPVACAAGHLTLVLSGGDGAYTLTVTQTDAAGNTSATASLTYLLDTTAPGAPGITGAGGPSSATSARFVLTGEDGASWTCTLTAPDGTTTTVSCSAGLLVLNLSGPDGVWTLRAVQTDAVGNASGATSVTYALDRTPPARAQISGPSGPSAERSPVFGLAGSDGTTWTCTVTGPGGEMSTGGCGPGALSVALRGADGTYTLTVTVADAAGNSSASSATYLLDTTAPAAPRLTDDGSEIRWDVVTDPNTTLHCSVEGDAVVVVACSDTGVALDTEIPVGSWYLVVVAVDEAGNTSEVARLRVVRESPALAPPLPVPPPVEPPVEPPAPEPEPEPEPAPAQPAQVAGPPSAVPAVVAEAAPALLVYASTGQVAGRALSRIVGTIASFDPRWRDTLRLASEAAKTGGFPLLLLLLAFVFLAVQDRIDRNDPKLALAPVHTHQELVFRGVAEGAT